MVAMSSAQVAVEEGLLRVGFVGCRCVKSIMGLCKRMDQCVGGESLLGVEVRVEGAVREPGRLHDLGHARSLEPALAEQSRCLGQNPVVLSGRFTDGVPHSSAS